MDEEATIALLRELEETKKMLHSVTSKLESSTQRHDTFRKAIQTALYGESTEAKLTTEILERIAQLNSMDDSNHKTTHGLLKSIHEKVNDAKSAQEIYYQTHRWNGGLT